MKNKKQAFTLVELLVVIAIIGILATLAVVSLQNARARARDSKRIADVRQMQTALELYFNDWNAYPATLGTSIASGTTYMAVVPTAPTPHDNSSGSVCTSGNNAYVYTSASPNSTYTITFCLGAQTGGLAAGVKTASPGGIQ